MYKCPRRDIPITLDLSYGRDWVWSCPVSDCSGTVFRGNALIGRAGTHRRKYLLFDADYFKATSYSGICSACLLKRTPEILGVWDTVFIPNNANKKRAEVITRFLWALFPQLVVIGG